MNFEKKISPSKLAELETCSCFWQDNTQQNAAAATGDLMHEAFEKEDVTLLQEADQREAITQCLEYCRNLAPNPVPKDGRVIGTMDHYDIVLNEPWLESDIGKKGRADKIIFPADDKELAHIVDIKTGSVPVVHAKDNAQGADYAMRVFLKWPNIQRVAVHFIMPKQKDVTTHTFNRDPDFNLLRERIINIHERYNDPFKVPSPNLEKACAYCHLKAKCPALNASAVSVARRFNVLPIPEDFKPEAPRTPVERGLAQDLFDMMIKWAEAGKKYNSESVKLGAEAEGYRVQTKRGIVSVADSAAFVSGVAEKYDIPTSDLYRAAGSISLPDVVEYLKAQNPEFDAKELRSDLERSFGAFLKQGAEVSFLVKERKGKKKEVQDAIATQSAEQQKLREAVQKMEQIGE